MRALNPQRPARAVSKTSEVKICTYGPDFVCARSGPFLSDGRLLPASRIVLLTTEEQNCEEFIPLLTFTFRRRSPTIRICLVLPFRLELISRRRTRSKVSGDPSKP